MLFPKPDRSNHKPNSRKSEENPSIDIGWDEGFLNDGRPYRAECWAEDGVTGLTFFMSTSGIENLSNSQFVELLEREGLVQWTAPERRSVGAMPFSDASGNSMWSINLVVGDDAGTFLRDHLKLRPYGDPRSIG
jgi:hypothetical protein